MERHPGWRRCGWALRDLVALMAPTDAGLAASIRVLVDAYDYDRLLRLLEAAKGKVR